MLKNLISKIWSKISYATNRSVRNYVLFILYHYVIPVISLGGSRMNLKQSKDKGSWNNWNNDVPSPLIKKQPGKRWVIEYVSWCFKSKNLWLLGLLPFIVIIKNTETELDTTTLESTLMYTLF